MRFEVLHPTETEISRRITAVHAPMDGMLNQVLYQEPLFSRVAERFYKSVESCNEVR
jgi:hypothetical protein